MYQRLKSLDFKGNIIAGVDSRRIPETNFITPLMTGKTVGSGKNDEFDIALNPLECAEGMSKGKLNSCSVICTSSPGGMMKIPNVYMEKIAVGPQLKGHVSLDQPLQDMFAKAANILGKEVEELKVVILDRERNKKLIEKVRKFGPQIRLFADGDLAAGMGTHPWTPEDIDFALGSGKSYQGLMTAVGLKCMGGDFQGRFLVFNNEDKKEVEKYGVDTQKVYGMKDLVPGNQLTFAATGVAQSPFLKGIRFLRSGAKTRSVVARSASGTIRYVDTYHNFDE